MSKPITRHKMQASHSQLEQVAEKLRKSERYTRVYLELLVPADKTLAQEEIFCDGRFWYFGEDDYNYSGKTNIPPEHRILVIQMQAWSTQTSNIHLYFTYDDGSQPGPYATSPAVYKLYDWLHEHVMPNAFYGNWTVKFA